MADMDVQKYLKQGWTSVQKGNMQYTKDPRITPEYPPQGTAQPSHLGSQSQAPNKASE